MTTLTDSDKELIAFFSAEGDVVLNLATSSASLDRSPKKNWVENAGGLPPYVRKLARAIAKRGKSLDSAIAIAISRVKAWAAGGGDVDADTRAKAVKALAQWEALKAKSKVAMSHEDGTTYLMLSSVSSFNTEIVRAAWNSIEEARRRQFDSERSALPNYELARYEQGYPYRWIVELGSDYLVVAKDETSGQVRYRIPYSVDEDENVSFGAETKIIQLWVEDSGDLSVSEKRALADIISSRDALKRVAALAKKG